MFVPELDSFLHKFHQMWSAGHSAHLNLETHAGNAWVGLRVQLGHAHGHHHHQHHPQFPQSNKNQESPSRQRRRARRTAARQADAESPSGNETVEETAVHEEVDKTNRIREESIVEETESDSKEVSESTEHFDQNDITVVDTAEEASAPMIVPDEVCDDKEYESATVENDVKSICSVDFYPEKYLLDGLESFRANIEEYFSKRTDVIKKVIKCDVVNYGNNVNLVVEVNVPRGWIFFFFDQEENYPDLKGVRTVRHSCRD